MGFTERLLLFLRVAESKSFTSAAEQMQVNRSMVSKQIHKLENELGIRLLNRTTRSMSLTSAGNEILVQAKRLRTVLDETRLQAQCFHTKPMGSLRINSTCHFGRHYVQKAVVQYQKLYPEISIELRLEDKMVDLIAENFDLGFRTGYSADSSLIYRELARNRLLIVASPDFLQRRGTPQSVAELEQLPAAVYSSNGSLMDKFKYYESNGEESYIHLNVVYKTNEQDGLIEAAVTGNMLSVVTASMINNEILEGKLVPVMTHINLADFGTFYAVYPHRDLPLKSRLFLGVIQKVIGERVPIWEQRIPDFEKLYVNRSVPSALISS
ncbi:LysR family transcriptional regulator [Kistimonas asteriae]|uniref:LysR family transcriptional regulator n=1 Tax=Kistimonas asteriae TaxID=517724 RepID=UPI001BAE11EC|nr:LysR family transcriptional regulator [Kistimonas asteriae]